MGQAIEELAHFIAVAGAGYAECYTAAETCWIDLKVPLPARIALPSAYLQGFSGLHALMRNVRPMSPPSQPEKGQSLMILEFTTTSMCTSKSGMTSKFSNL